MRAALLAVIVLTAGCGGKARPADAPMAEASCDNAAKGIAKVYVGDPVEQDVPSDLITQEKQAMTPIFADVCTRDAWSAPTMGCFAGAETLEAFRGCASTLAADQKEHLAAALDDAEAARGATRDTSDADE